MAWNVLSVKDVRVISLSDQQKRQLRKALQGQRPAPILGRADRVLASEYGNEITRLLAPLGSKYLDGLERRRSA